MRKINQKVNDQAIINQVLSKSLICRIAINDDVFPYILPLNYGYANNCLYMHCAKEGKKIDLLNKNNKVCFEIEQKAELVKHEIACKWATVYRSIIGYGSISIIQNKKDIQNALNIIMKHNGAQGEMSFDDNHLASVAVLRLSIESLTCKQSSNWDEQHEINEVNFNTERLDVREVLPEHAENIHALHCMPEVDEFNTMGIPKNFNETKAMVDSIIEEKSKKNRSAYHWCVFEKQSGDFIGMAGMFLSNDKFKLGEIYYKFNPAYWGKGYATELAAKLIKLGFENFKLHKVEAGVAVGNMQSVKVLEKVGMQREGLRRKILPIRGKWVDNYHYAIIENSDK